MNFQIMPTQVGQVIRISDDTDHAEYLVTKVNSDTSTECVLLRDVQRYSSNPDAIARHTYETNNLTVIADSLEKYVQSWNGTVPRPATLKAYFIENLEDVRQYLRDIHLIYDREFHPDDDFSDFTGDNDEVTFSKKEAEYLNSIMVQCFDICDKNDVEIYDVAGEVQIEVWQKKGLWP